MPDKYTQTPPERPPQPRAPVAVEDTVDRLAKTYFGQMASENNY
jgi:hypothetical protein